MGARARVCVCVGEEGCKKKKKEIISRGDLVCRFALALLDLDSLRFLGPA